MGWRVDAAPPQEQPDHYRPGSHQGQAHGALQRLARCEDQQRAGDQTTRPVCNSTAPKVCGPAQKGA